MNVRTLLGLRQNSMWSLRYPRAQRREILGELIIGPVVLPHVGLECPAIVTARSGKVLWRVASRPPTWANTDG